jgi:ABC-type molybdate transport system permease subunit
MHPTWSDVAAVLRVAAGGTVLSFLTGLGLGHVLETRKISPLALSLPLPPTIICSYFLLPHFTEGVAIAAAVVYWTLALARSSRQAFQCVDGQYLDAARIAGASEWRVFWRIDLPLAAQPLLSAAVTAFALIAAEYAFTLWIAQR